MKRIYAMLPCYNEGDNIGKLIEKWESQEVVLKAKGYELKIIVIDDGSDDNTVKNIILKQKMYENIEIVQHKKNMGLCEATNTAINYFNSNANFDDIMVFMDGDNSHNPKYVVDMLDNINESYDCVICSRYKKRSDIYGLGKDRVVLSNLARLYYKGVLKIKNVEDYTCGYRMYTYNIISKLVNKYGNKPLKEKSFACAMELLYKIYLVGGRFIEVPFCLEYNEKSGKSKMKIVKTMYRSVTTSLKLRLQNSKLKVGIILFVILFSIFLSLATNFSPINRNIIFHDCGIFSYVGFAMKNGKVPYKEVFENKGPLLYIIYYLGLCIADKGVYFLELIAIIISVAFSYKIIKLISCKDFYAIIGTIYTFSVWSITFEGGTFSEIFALPAIFLGIYILLKNLMSNVNISTKEIVILGVLTGIVATLRLNMLAIFLGFYCVIGINLISKKEFKEIIRWLFYGVCGFAIVVVPIAIYFLRKDALIDCLNTAYFGVLDNFNVGGTRKKVEAILAMLLKFNISSATVIMLLFFLVGIILLVKRNSSIGKYKISIAAIILALLINIYANSISGAVEMHYFVTFIPLICAITGWLLKVYDKIDLNVKVQVKNVWLVFFVILLVANGYVLQFSWLNYRYTKVDNNSQYSKIIEYINNNSSNQDLVQIIGGREEAVCANFNTKRLSASKYSYLPLWDTFNEQAKNKMVNELVNDVIENIPELLIICDSSREEFYSLITDKEKWNEFIKQEYLEDTNTIENYCIYSRK